MSDQLLIDECLSSVLVASAKERGVLAQYLPWVGMTAWKDWNIVQFALENNYVIVTKNRRDFLKEYLKLDVHNGLIIVVPDGNKEDQIRMFDAVLDILLGIEGDLINRLVEVLADGTVHIRKWTSEDHDIRHINAPAW